MSAIHSKLAGTRGYIDPEYVSGGKYTAVSDIYSYGVILFELLTGKPPISEGSISDIKTQSKGELLTQPLFERQWCRFGFRDEATVENRPREIGYSL